MFLVPRTCNKPLSILKHHIWVLSFLSRLLSRVISVVLTLTVIRKNKHSVTGEWFNKGTFVSFVSFFLFFRHLPCSGLAITLISYSHFCFVDNCPRSFSKERFSTCVIGCDIVLPWRYLVFSSVSENMVKANIGLSTDMRIFFEI